MNLISQVIQCIFQILFRETIPIRDIVSCKKINSWTNYHHFEIMYKDRQIYRVKSKISCDTWIEKINSSIIFSKFWTKIMENTNVTLSEYFGKQKEEVLNIAWDKEEKIEIVQIKQISSNEEPKSEDEKNRSNSTKNRANSKGDKKERRKNPYTRSKQNLICS
jgi:hypothetical protein